MRLSQARTRQRAEAHRLRGNACFAAGLHREATEAYSRAVELLELRGADGEPGGEEAGALAVCLANRAVAWLRRKQWAAALADCNRVLRSGCVDMRDAAARAASR